MEIATTTGVMGVSAAPARGTSSGTTQVLDLPTVLRFAELALVALGEAREEIDALNVYPVPDGDTGTNLYLTVESARNAMLEALEPDEEQAGPEQVAIAVAAFARGALLGARGNSGVILSSLVGALCHHLAAADPAERPSVVLADGLARATEACYAAVGDPVEGTILSVVRAASDAAAQAAAVPAYRTGHVIRAAAAAARTALARTPDQLALLRDAGVVDAGGRGLCVVLDAAETAVTGRRPVSGRLPLGVHAIPVPLACPRAAAPDRAGGHPVADRATGLVAADAVAGPAFEVMYLLDAEDDRVPVLRRALADLGDSLVVVGGDGLWNVHVHVDDVGSAVEAGIAVGRPHRVRVTHLVDHSVDHRADHRADHWADHWAEQVDSPRDGPHRDRPAARQGRSVVAVAAGPGLGDLFLQAGATVVPSTWSGTSSGTSRRPSTGQVLDAIEASAAAEVILLPNDRDSIAVAEAAARTVRVSGEVRVAVVPTNAQVQGLAALAVHEPGRSFEDDLVAMTAAARHARSGAVTIAARQAMTTAGPCETGDVLGVIEGDFVMVGSDLLEVTCGILERLLGGGGELVTLVAGAAGGSSDLADRAASYLTDRHPTVDVVVYAGGQPRYPLLVGVE